MRSLVQIQSPQLFVTANPANGCESHCWRDSNFCTDVSLLAAFTLRKAPDHAGKPPEQVQITQTGGCIHRAPVHRADSRDIAIGRESGHGETVPASQQDDLKDEPQ